jgi:hypothetical protein
VRGDTYHVHIGIAEGTGEVWHRHELGESEHRHDELPMHYPANALGSEMVITLYWWSWIIMLFTAVGFVLGGYWLLVTVIKFADWIGWLS